MRDTCGTLTGNGDIVRPGKNLVTDFRIPEKYWWALEYVDHWRLLKKVSSAT
jgi:hypothetical protein